MTDPRRAAVLRAVDPGGASDDEVTAFARLADRLRLERATGDPQRSVESYRANLRGIAAFSDIEVAWWHAETDGELVGHGFASATLREDNRHIADLVVEVAKPYRRRGIGRALLARLVAFARQQQRTLLILESSNRIPDGEGFARWLGAELALRSHTNQLDLSEVDRDRVASWIRGGERVSDRYQLGSWVGPYPQAEIGEIAEMHHVMNSQPRGDLAAEDEVLTPEILRQREAYMAERGTERTTLFVRHRSSGRLVGYTETFWDPHDPETLGQGDTGVLSEHRGNGLGKWLKAAMLARIFEERPEAKRIRTGNADSNDAMLAINRALGYRPFTAHSVWQLPVDRAEERLAEGAPD